MDRTSAASSSCPPRRASRPSAIGLVLVATLGGCLLASGRPIGATQFEGSPVGLTVTKTSDLIAVSFGDVITYTVTSTNTGADSINGLSINDPMAGLGPFDCGPVALPTTLRAGATLTCTAMYTVTQADVDRGNIPNTVTVSGTRDSGAPESVQASHEVGTVRVVSYEFTKAADVSSVDEAGDVITYTFVFADRGTVTHRGVTISDELDGLSPLSCSQSLPATVPPGGTLTCTAAYTVTPTDIVRGSITNLATMRGSNSVGGTFGESSVTVVVVPPPATTTTSTTTTSTTTTSTTTTSTTTTSTTTTSTTTATSTTTTTTTVPVASTTEPPAPTSLPAGALIVSPDPIDFGVIPVGALASRGATVSNTSDDAVSIEAVSLRGAPDPGGFRGSGFRRPGQVVSGPFTLRPGTCAGPLAPGASCTVALDLATAVPGTYTDVVRFVTSAGTFDIDVSATVIEGAPPTTVVPSTATSAPSTTTPPAGALPATGRDSTPVAVVASLLLVVGSLVVLTLRRGG